MGRAARAWVVVWVATCVACNGDAVRSAFGWLDTGTHRINFGAATLGLEQRRTIDVSQRGLIEAAVESIALVPDEGVFSVLAPPTRVGRDASAPMTIAYRPSHAGQHRARLVVSLESGPPLEVWLAGKGVDARALGDATLRFGRPLLGTSRMRPLRLANEADAAVPVSLAVIGRDAAEFTVTPSRAIEPSSMIEVPVVFAPVGLPGRREASLRIVRCPTCTPEDHPIEADAIERPLEVSPSPVSFGTVPVDTERRQEVVVSNVSDLFVSVKTVSLEAYGDEGFELEVDGLPRVLAPLDTMRIPLRFSPTRLGLAQGSIVIASDAPLTPLVTVPLLASAGGAQLVVTPETLAFRATTAMGRSVLPVRISNGGADPASAPLTLQGISIDGEAFGLVQTVAPGTTLAAGRSVDLRVSFSPTHPGSFSGRLRVQADDPMTPAVDVALEGNATDASDCVLSVQPPRLSFGDVRPGKGALLGVRITHSGPRPCALWDGRVQGDPSFSLQRPRPFVRLAPGGSVFMPVAFRPPAAGRYAATLSVQTSSALQPELQLPIDGVSSDACLRGDPAYVEFGRRRVDCGPVVKEAIFRNACNAALDVASLEIGPASDPGVFSLLASTPTPTTLAPGQPIRASILFTPGVPGFTAAPLFATASFATDPVLATLTGESLPAALHDESWIQPAPAKVDLLWVVDNTASLQDERAALARSIGAFVRDADARGLDYHVGVTTTGIDVPPAAATLAPCPGGVHGAEAGRLFPVDHARARIVDASMLDRADALAKNVDVGGCHTVEQGFEAMRRALSPPLVNDADDPRTLEPLDGNAGFLRADAALAVVVVSDEDDASPLDAAAAVALVRALKPSSPVAFGAIVAPAGGCVSAVSPGVKYLEVARALDGFVASVCDDDWSPSLARLADRLLAPLVRYLLAAPADPASLVVTVDGAPAVGVRYEASPPALVFDVPPAPGTAIRVTYAEPCPP